MSKIQRRDRRIADKLSKGRSVEYIAEDMRISQSEVESSIKKLKKAGLMPEKPAKK